MVFFLSTCIVLQFKIIIKPKCRAVTSYLSDFSAVVLIYCLAIQICNLDTYLKVVAI